MTKRDYINITRAIWRSGFIKDKNKIRQEAREKMRHLIASDILGTLINDKMDINTKSFWKDCGF